MYAIACGDRDAARGWDVQADDGGGLCRAQGGRVRPGAGERSRLRSSFGGFGPELLELLRGAAEFKMNKLSAAEYDETTWSARTWLTFAMQRISVAVHKAVAKELSDALGFSGAVDPRGAPRD